MERLEEELASKRAQVRGVCHSPCSDYGLPSHTMALIASGCGVGRTAGVPKTVALRKQAEELAHQQARPPPPPPPRITPPPQTLLTAGSVLQLPKTAAVLEDAEVLKRTLHAGLGDERLEQMARLEHRLKTLGPPFPRLLPRPVAAPPPLSSSRSSPLSAHLTHSDPHVASAAAAAAATAAAARPPPPPPTPPPPPPFRCSF